VLSVAKLLKQQIDIAKNGSIVRAVALLSSLSKEHGVRLTIEEAKSRRSDQQNKYLWGVCYATMLKVLPEGWIADDLHEFWLGEFYGWDILEGLGRKRMKPKRRSSRLSTVEFAAYVAFLQQQAAERLGVYIADPE
jgi:hypothetical protein